MPVPPNPLSPLTRPPTRKMFAQENLQQWFFFPETLPSGKFTGYQTRYDETQNRGAWIAGQNVKMTQAQTPTLRNGTQLIGTDLQDSYPVNRAWLFETRNGDQFEIKAYNTSLHYWLWGHSTDWSLLIDGFTPGLPFGYGNVGKESNPTTSSFFSNGVDGVYEFDGAFGVVKAVSNAMGVVSSIDFSTLHGGSGYVVNDVLTITGGDGTATAKVLAVVNGAVTGISISAGSSGYVIGDVLTIITYGTGATIHVDTIGAFGVITGATLVTEGQNYEVATNVSVSGGSGVGALFNITSVANGSISSLVVVNPGSGYSTGTDVGTTGGTGTGAEVDILSVQQGYIQFVGTTDVADLGFYTTGLQQVIVNGTVFSYVSAGSGTTSLTGIAPDPTTIPIGSVVVQTPRKQDGGSGTTDMSGIQGNIMTANDGRLHMNNYTKADVWQYSMLDNPFDFTTGSDDGDGGAKEVEFGGPILAFGKLNKSALAIKARIIKSLDFIQSGTRIDVPDYTDLVSADDKSSSIGNTNQKSTFSTPFGLVFITPDNRMVLLTGITANGEPQYFVLSDPIAAVLKAGLHDEGAGICVDNRIYYSFKQSPQSTFNDVEIQGNMLLQSFDSQGKAMPIFWDTPNIGINCNDYTAVYNPSISGYEVHRHSSLNSNTFREIMTSSDDDGEPFTAVVRSWGEVLNQPDEQKYIDYILIEIKMMENSIIYVNPLFDQNGVNGAPTYTLKGTDTANLIDGANFNPFGASAYGQNMFGSNTVQPAMLRYIYWLELAPNQEFFSISLQFSTDTPNSNFEVIRMGYRLVKFMPEIALEFKKNTTVTTPA